MLNGSNVGTLHSYALTHRPGVTHDYRVVALLEDSYVILAECLLSNVNDLSLNRAVT
jgi:hypothetical protein